MILPCVRCRSIPHVETLTSLNVSDNRLTATSLLELFKGMHPPPGLTDRPTPLIRLDVSENAVGGDAAAVHALVQLVSHSHSLEELRLARAQLGTEVKGASSIYTNLQCTSRCLPHAETSSFARLDSPLG
jgi:hypothetical protein